jgi:crotonobetainyl-CoA:carnitine CoA-transferase CaiB-like acyl-CoA transferase
MNFKNEGSLKEIRILDFTRVLAGPYATRVLGDLGAEVIKVQSKKTAKGSELDGSAYFRTWNRNKRSIGLDMDYPEAREVILNLTGLCDVVVENFSPRVMANWGLTYEKLREVRPDIIMLSMSAMGQTGPWRDYAGYGQTMQALSGMTYMTSWDEHSPSGLGQAYADVISGLYGVVAVLAALEYRDRSGRGQHLDLSECEAMCSVMGPALLDASCNQRGLIPRGNSAEEEPAAPYGCYRCLGIERWCVIAVYSEAQWQALCHVLGDASWAKDERFSTLPLRKQNGEELNTLLGQWTAGRRAEDLVKTLQESGIPAGVVQNAQDLAADPQLAAKEFFVKLDHPLKGCTVADNLPIKSGDRLADHWKPAPFLGEDNRYVFLELLGFDERQFNDYVTRGIIG